GYAELNVDHSDHILQVEIKPERREYRPGQLARAQIELRDHQGNPVAGEVTFMAVHQGVLSLTGYKTPEPAGFFFAPYPLGVLTRDGRKLLSTRAEIQAAVEATGNKSSTAGDGGAAGMNYRSEFAPAAAF